ncbi:MAG: ABC transporter ATP-binding protein/permease [Candidatus Omnitrophica bacterium]|nr:ABC transporter ATP-binding protein/permease [Candidatus Omnitrophota bacterium]
MRNKNFEKWNFSIFFEYLKPYKKSVILAPLFMILEVVMDLFQPKLLAHIIDDGIIKGDLKFIIHTGFLMLGIAVVGLIGGIGCTIFSSIASQNFGHDLRKGIFKKIQSVQFKDSSKFSPSSLITRLTNDVSQVQQLVLISLRMLVRAPFLCLGGIIMAFSINLKLSLIIFIVIPLLLFIFYFITRKSFSLFTVMQNKIDRINLIIRENLAGIRVIKIFNREQYEKERFENANAELVVASLKAIKLIVKIGPIVMIIVNLSIIAVLWFGGRMSLNGEIMVGEIMAFINYLMIILMSLMMISNLFIFISRAGASIERIDEILKIKEPSRKEKFYQSVSIKGKVDFKNVFFSYTSDTQFLQNISFSIEAGETLGIVGITGSGKTTLLNLITGLYQPVSGEILIDGRKINDIDPYILKENIGFVTQEAIIFSGTIREIMRWANENVSDVEISEALKIAEIYDFVKKLPYGFETFIGQKGVNLSGGQKQRLTIARALVRKPKILILDDCTSSVDFITEKRILKNLKGRLNTCCTKVIVTPRIFTVIEADKIIVLEKGKIVGIGDHKQLLENCDVYREIYESQTGERINV